MNQPTIIHIYPEKSLSVAKDNLLLKKHFKNLELNRKWNNKYLTPIHLIEQFFFLLFKTPKCKVILVMFGGYWSLLPAVFGRIYKKPVYIKLGGTDCVSFPSLHYGSLRKPLLKLFIRWSYQLCSKLIPVDDTLILRDSIYYPTDGNSQGVKTFFPNLKTPFEVIHNGYYSGFWKIGSQKRIPNSIVVVANISRPNRLLIKGIDIILELAKKLPKYKFLIIGSNPNIIEQNLGKIPSNCEVIDFASHSEIKNYLQKNEYYSCLSISEGFPNAICEAMLCGCIPIGSNVASIPKIIGKTGLIVNRRNVNEIAVSLEEFIDGLSQAQKVKRAMEARSRIMENFDIRQRSKKLINLLSS